MTSEFVKSPEISTMIKKIDICITDQISTLPSEASELLQNSSKGGKRIRALLLLLTGLSSGGTGDTLIPVAAAMELIHFASLIHDDLIDGHKIRRGYPVIHSIISSSTAVLIADTLLSKSLSIMADADPLVIKSVINSLMKMSDSEIKAHLGKIGNSFLPEQYLLWIKDKTASLFVSCALCGAIIAGVDPNSYALYKQLGELFGVAFQIQDDVLDYSETETFRPAGSDLYSGKVTLPLIQYREETGITPALKLWIEGSRDSDTINNLITEIRRSSAINAAHAEALRYARDASFIVNSIPSLIMKNSLMDLCLYAAERIH